jgi:sec-independent protein translocase protein TatA
MGIGVIEPWHLVLILIIALVVFGPGKLGDIGGSLGRGIREFRTSMTVDDVKEAKPDEEKKVDATVAKKETSDKAS